MTDREERQHVIEVLNSWDGYFIGYSSDEVQEALRYAINSIEVDLKYDLLYEETSGQADKPTTKENLVVDAISRQAINGYIDYILSHGMGKKKSFDFIKKFVANLPSVTLQHSSGLDKNSKKLEKDFGESDCISREQAKAAIRDKFKDLPSRVEINTILNELPSVTPQEPRKGHWIECMPGGAEEWCYKCSECNFWKYKKSINLNKFKFCPNCGSDNSEVKE